jgi:hypothetical protein
MKADCYLDTKRMRVSDVQSNFGLAVREVKISTEILGDSEYEITVKQSAEICLIMKSSGRRIEMMKLKPRGDYMIRAPLDSEKMSYEMMGLSSSEYCWLSSKPLEFGAAVRFLRNANDLELEWSKNTLKLRLDHHNIRPSSVIISRPEEDLASEHSEDLSGFDFSMDELNAEYSEMAELLGVEDMTELNKDADMYDTAGLFSIFTEENVLVEDFAEASRPTVTFVPEKRNKFWDGFISQLKETSGKTQLENVLSNSPVYDQMDDFMMSGPVRLFYRLMRGIPVNF